MNKIQVLDSVTIDKIAAGEVIERPASVVKELVENAIDAGATSVTVEITDGGISFIRIADNGCGIAKEDVRPAFYRHSTSKIRSVDDLSGIRSLGFRGEALSSIAAVSQTELLTKTREDEFGTRYIINGGKEESLEEAGAPDGTSFFIRQLFYNIPARRKFLKTPMTEASHVGELMNRIALSHPEISFRFINNGQPKLHTSGNGQLKDVIYHIYGRDVAENLFPAEYEKNGLSISGFIGAPLISRGNRNFENYFVNRRYIKSQILYKSIEDAYKDFTMQHRFPFTVLHIGMSGEDVDVNVHPAKMEVRFHNQQELYEAVYEAVSQSLHGKELIPKVTVDVPRAANAAPERAVSGNRQPEKPQTGKQTLPPAGERDLAYFMEEMKRRVHSYHEQNSREHAGKASPETRDGHTSREEKAVFGGKDTYQANMVREPEIPYRETKGEQPGQEPAKQLDLFEEKFLERKAQAEHKLVGQVFDTYWLVEYRENLYIIDQHAAHERVLYERTLSGMKTREFTSQMISPPIVLNLTMQEQEALKKYEDRFTRIGFEFEEFGQGSYAVRAVPGNLFSIAKKELLLDMLDSLSDELGRNLAPELIDEKIASMSCKAAVKGNMRLSAAEADALIGELLVLENPYHCPHGRPTIIAMPKRELEKKFKRIV